MDCTSSNGRVDILGPNIDQLFAMSDKIAISESPVTSFRDAMTGNWNNTALSDTFFSAANIQIVQNGIRAGVYNKSNSQYVVGEQSCDELKIVMRSIFLQYSQNLPADIPQQIATLNKYVLDYCIKAVYGEAQGYMKYRFDASTLVVPIALPIMSKTNDKQLILKKWF
jgi:hypothetical protein